MSVTEFSNNPQSSNPATIASDLDGFNAELGARLAEVTRFGNYIDARTGDASAQPLWVSGTAYSDGDTVYSPTDFLPYRANKDIASSTTDPSLDGGTDWDGAGGVAAADLVKLGYMTVTEAIDLDISQDRLILTANGAVTAGDLLVLEDAGTVKGVSYTAGVWAEAANDIVVAGAASTVSFENVFPISANQAILAYEDSNTLYVVVMTYSGGTVSAGTPVSLGVNANQYGLCVDAANSQGVITYTNATNSDVYARGFTWSGTTITLQGSLQTVQIGTFGQSRASISNGYVFVHWVLAGGMQIACATISSGSVGAFGTAVTVATGITSAQSYAQIELGSDYVVICYGAVAPNQLRLQAVQRTSGTTLSAGTAVTVGDGGAYVSGRIVKVSDTRLLVSYTKADNKAYANTYDRSGTSLSANTETEIHDASANNISTATLAFNSSTGVALMFFNTAGNSYYVEGVSFSLSGTTITPDDNAEILVSTGVQFPGSWPNTSDGTFGVVYNDYFTGGDDYVAGVYNPGAVSTDAADWIGFADHSAADGESVIINTAGDVDDNQTGLTIGTTYYADDDGSLTATPNSRKVGKAVAADKLYITERRA